MDSYTVCSYVCFLCSCLCSSLGATILLSSAHSVGVPQAVCLPADGHLGCFLVWAAVHEAAVDMCVGVFAWVNVYLSLHKYPGVELLGHRGKHLFLPSLQVLQQPEWGEIPQSALFRALYPGEKPLDFAGPALGHRGISLPNQ